MKGLIQKLLQRRRCCGGLLLYRDERIFAHLLRVLQEDDDARMRDAAYGALLRLAIAPEEKSQEVETTLAVEMMQGGGMLLDTPETLLLRVSHHGHDPLPTVEIRLVGSVEYDVESPNPLLLTQVLPQVRRDVAFQLRAKVAHRIALNDKVNTA